MTGWLIALALAGLVLAGLWRMARPGRAALQYLAASLLLALAGYAWQGSPGLPGSPRRAPKQAIAESDRELAYLRQQMFGQFTRAQSWLMIADSFERRGDTESAARVLSQGAKLNPRSADLWVGLGNALVRHGGGVINPAAELAFRRAAAIAPDHPGPRFFFGLALAQAGRLDEAEAMWRALLAAAPANAPWRGEVEERLTILQAIRQGSPG